MSDDTVNATARRVAIHQAVDAIVDARRRRFGNETIEAACDELDRVAAILHDWPDAVEQVWQALAAIAQGQLEEALEAHGELAPPRHEPVPPPGGWRKPECSFETHKWALEVEDGRASLVCTDPCDATLFEPADAWPHASPVCLAEWESGDIVAPESIPVTVTYVDDSTPSTPVGPAEYGYYLEARPPREAASGLRTDLASPAERHRTQADGTPSPSLGGGPSPLLGPPSTTSTHNGGAS